MPSSCLGIVCGLEWVTTVADISNSQVVTVALRCPSGHLLRRRFFKSWNSQVRKSVFSEIASYEIWSTVCSNAVGVKSTQFEGSALQFERIVIST